MWENEPKIERQQKQQIVRSEAIKPKLFYFAHTFSHRSLAYFIFAFNHPIDK